jgi:Holliday junction resolvase RusA-like endonuclease
MTSLRLSRLDKLLVPQSGQREDMDNLLQQLQDLLKEFNRFISDKHFDHRVDPQQLVTTFWGEQ